MFITIIDNTNLQILPIEGDMRPYILTPSPNKKSYINSIQRKILYHKKFTLVKLKICNINLLNTWHTKIT